MSCLDQSVKHKHTDDDDFVCSHTRMHRLIRVMYMYVYASSMVLQMAESEIPYLPSVSNIGGIAMTFGQTVLTQKITV